MNFNLLRNELKNYFGYKKEMERLRGLYNNTFYKATGVSGVDNTKIRVMMSEAESQNIKLDTIERLDEINKQYKEMKYKYYKLNYWLNKLPSQLKAEVLDTFVYNTKKRDRNNIYRLKIDCDRYLKG